MLLRVDPLSPDPIFEQLAFQVKGAIARGELGPGDRLPSVRELAREVGVNPNTVVRTYETLEAERVIVRKQGAGTFVGGGKSVLAEAERERQLAELAERAVTEAYHLGFEAQHVRAAIARALEASQLASKKASSGRRVTRARKRS